MDQSPLRPPKENPFSDQHYEIMCRGADSCAATKDCFERLQRAGMDVSVQLGENQQQYDLFTGLKREFFPQRP